MGNLKQKYLKGKLKMTEKFNFEAAMIRLNQISELLESDSVAIDEALELFEEGLDLSKQCQDVLSGYENKVKTLVQKHTQEKQDETI